MVSMSRTLVVVDPGHGGKIPFVCKQCGTVFYVRPCYVARGNVGFCSIGCGTTYRNLRDNPAHRPEVRAKIAEHHADVSGMNNPMFGVSGPQAPSWVVGRKSFSGDIWRRVFLASGRPMKCEVCGDSVKGRRFHVHHKDKDRRNNSMENLMGVCVGCHNNEIHPPRKNAEGRFQSEVARVNA